MLHVTLFWSLLNRPISAKCHQHRS